MLLLMLLLLLVVLLLLLMLIKMLLLLFPVALNCVELFSLQREIKELRGKLSRLGGKLQDEVINRQVSALD